MFEALQKKQSVKDEGDTIFGAVLETNVYPITLDKVYADQSEGGAAFLHISGITDTGKTVGMSVYFTSGDKKGNSITFKVKDKQGNPTAEERYLPGFVFCDDLHEILLGVPLAEMETQQKLVNAYNKEAKRDIPQTKAVLTGMIGKVIKVAIQEQLVIKQINVDGVYVDTNPVETRKQNEFIKAYDAETGQTLTEKQANAEPVFMNKWIASFSGQVIDKTGGQGKNPSVNKANEKNEPKSQKMFG